MEIREADIAVMGRAAVEELIDLAVRPDVPLRVLFAALDRYTELVRPALADEPGPPEAGTPDLAGPAGSPPAPQAPTTAPLPSAPPSPMPAAPAMAAPGPGGPPVAPEQQGPPGPPGPPHSPG